MYSFLDTIADVILRQSLQVLVIFLAVLAITRGLRTASAHWRYWLWLIVIAKCLTPPLFDIPLAILPARSAVDGSSKPDTVQPTSDSKIQLPSLILDIQPTDPSSVEFDSGNTQPTSFPLHPSVQVRRLSGRQWFAILWIVIAGVLLGYVAGKAWSADRILRRHRQSVDPETQAIVAELSASMGMDKAPAVYLASPIGQPFVWGWLRGCIYLPNDFATAGPIDQRRAILAHELAHIARWDAATNLIQIFVQSLFFFHPLIWWANSRVRQEREKCCDEVVLSGLGIRPRAYCEAIVNMLTLQHQAAQAVPALAVTGATKNIADRLTLILSPNRKFCRRPSRLAVCLFMLLAVGILPTTFVATTRAQTEAKQDTGKSKSKSETATVDQVAADTQAWQPGQVMDFRVINAQTKEPISGVTLELQYTGKGIDFQDVKIQTTDDDGRSQITLPDTPLTEARVYPAKAGFVPLRVYWGKQPHVTLPKSITIPLEPGKPFGGTIFNEAGKPISNVEVNIHYWGDGAGENPHLRPNIIEKTTSDENGRWRFHSFPEEIEEKHLRIYLTHSDYVSDQVKHAFLSIPVTKQPSIRDLFARTAVMTMREGEVIESQVVDQNQKPIQGAKIYDREDYWYEPAKPRAVTDKEGKFRITGVELTRRGRSFLQPDGMPMKLTIQADGYAPELVDVQPSLPAIELSPGESVQGQVVDEAGNPVAKATVVASRWRDQRSRIHMETKTDEEGHFRLADVPTDKIEYTVWKDGYSAVEGLFMEPSDEVYQITTRAPLKIVGSVVDAETGKPLERFSLVRGVGYEDGRAPWWMRYDVVNPITNGRYETIFNQDNFSYVVRVDAEGYMPAISRVFRPHNPDEGVITYDFKLTRANRLQGTVVGLDGKPLAGAEVYLATQHMNIQDRKVVGSEHSRVKTDEAGRFEFPPEVELFCLVVLHEQGIAMTTEAEFATVSRLSLQPWTDKNSRLQIIRKPAPGQYVDFPVRKQ